MKRRGFLIAGGSLCALPFAQAVHAQAGKPYRIYGVTWRGKTQVEKGLEDYFGKRGIAVEFTWRDAEQKVARIAEFVAESAALKPDLIYTWGTPPTLNMAGPYDTKSPQQFVRNIPIIFAVVADPVGAKLVTSLKGQGRDITGVYHVAPLTAQLETMRTYRKFSTIGALYNAAEPNSVSTIKGLQRLAETQRFRLIEATFDRNTDGKPTPDGIEEKVARLKAEGAEWLYLGPDSYLFSQIARLANAALAQNLPTFSATEGALNSSSPVLTGLVSSYYTLGQFAGFKAEQILAKRTPAREIPIETLSRYSFIVRMDVAKQLDFLPPVSVFNYAVVR